MFGKKQDKTEPLPDIQVTTIPADFYAGVNPTVKFKEVEKTIELKPAEKKEFEKKAAAGGEVLAHPANFLTSKKFFIIAGISLFVLFAAGAGAYYWYQGKKTQAQVVPPQAIKPIVTATVPETPATTTEQAAPTSTPEEIPQVKETAIEMPSKLLGESVDFDADRVSDVAEEIFGTDPSNPDTDEDKYPDGHELYYLYNPNGFEPKKIIDSGFVQEYTNNPFGYSLYYPKNWTFGSVDAESRDVLFSVITGENIEVKVLDLTPGQTFADWLTQNAPDELVSDYSDMTSRFGSAGKMRNDGLAYFFLSGEKLVALVYHTTDSNIVNYKIVLEVMARSFEFTSPLEMMPGLPAATEFIPEPLSPTGTTSTEMITPTTTEETATNTEESDEPV